MTFDPHFQRTHDERIDAGKAVVNQEKDEAHEARIQAHCERVEREYFATNTHLGEIND